MMRGFIEWMRRRRRRARVRRAIALRRQLRRRYGKHDTYSPDQVRRVARDGHLSSADVMIALAVYTSASDFAGAGVTADQDALRGEVEALFPNRASGFADGEGLNDSFAKSIGGNVEGGYNSSGDGGSGGGLDGGGGGFD